MPDAQPFTLKDVADPAPFLPATAIPAWWWIVGTLAVLVVAIWLLRVIRSRGLPVPDPRQLRDSARRNALAALEATDRSLPPAALAAVVSLILRRYLADACGDPALFETHEEFLARGEVPAILPPDARHDLARFFAMLAAIKYAHDAPAPADDLVALARPLIDRTHAAFSP